MKSLVGPIEDAHDLAIVDDRTCVSLISIIVHTNKAQDISDTH